MDATLAGLLLLGAALFPWTFLGWQYFLKRWIRKRDVRVQIAASLTSILQDVMAFLAGVYVVSNCYHDFLYARCWLVDPYMCLGVPYMVYDIGALYAAYHTDAESKTDTGVPKKDTFIPFIRHQKIMIFHHIMVVFVGFPIALFLRSGKGEFFIGCMFLTEASSPFVNIRVILRKIDRTDSLPYWINDTLILVLFLLCRVLMFPIVFWVYSWGRGILWYQVPAHIPWHCTAGCAMICSLQLMWYLRFARGFMRRMIDWSVTGKRTRWYVGNTEIKGTKKE